MPGHGGRVPESSRRARRHCARRRREQTKACHAPCEGAPRACRAPRPRAGIAGASAAGASTTGESTGATRGAAPVLSGGEDEQLKEGRSARRARCRRTRRRRCRERRGDVIASHSRARGRRPEPRKGEEAEGRPLRGEDVGPRSRPGRSRSRRSCRGRCLGPALARRGGVAWSEEQSDEGARTAAARGARTRRQCQRLQMPRPKAAVVPGATVARAEGVPEDRKAPERARERRRHGPQGTPQVRARAACPGVG